MSVDDRPGALIGPEVREAVNRWSRGGLFRVRGLGDKLLVVDVLPHDGFTLRLQSQYEERTVGTVTVPYLGGDLDDVGTPPGTWEVTVPPAVDFEDRTEQRPVPHTDRVLVCPACGGGGRVPCHRCTGWGKVDCPGCLGRGFREQTLFQPGPPQPIDPANPQLGYAPGPAVPQTIRERCLQCMDGKVTCPNCQGLGREACGACGGGGRVKQFEQVTVKFRSDKASAVVQATGVPGHLLEQVTGALLYNDRQPRFKGPPPETPDAALEKVSELLRKAQAVDANSTVLLFQTLKIEKINVQEVVYRYGTSGRKQLFIYGNERRVYAPQAPTAWGRVALVVGGLVGLIGLVVWLVTR